MLLMYSNAMTAAFLSLLKSISLRFTEAEFIALSKAGETIVCLQNVLIDVDIHRKPTRVFHDNKGSVECANGIAG